MYGEMLSRAQEKAEKQGIEADLGDTQMEIGFAGGWLKYLSDQEHPILRTAHKFIRRLHANNLKAEQKLEKEIKEAVENLDKWTSTNNLSRKDAYDKIINNTNGNLITQFKHEFWTLKEKAQQDEDLKWLKDNLEFTADDKARFEAAKEREFKRLDELVDRFNEEFIEKKKEEWLSKYKPYHSPGKINRKAWLNQGWQFLSIKQDKISKWQSEEWLYMNKPENKPLKAFYDLHVEKMNEWATSLGIKWKGHYTANVRKEMLDQVLELGLMKGIPNFWNSFTASLQAYEGEWGHAEYLDPVTNKPKFKIPLMFTEPLWTEDKKINTAVKSRDIASSLYLFGRMAINHKHASEVEATLMMLQELTKPDLTKQAELTEGPEWSRRLKEFFGNSNTYDELTRQINFHLFGKETQGFGTESKTGVRNVKLVKKGMSMHRFMALPLNFISATGAFIATSANTYFNSVKGTHFTNKQFRSSAFRVGTLNKEQAALVEFFEASMSDKSQRRAYKLSMSAKKYINNDNLYYLFRKPDEILESVITGAMAENYGLDKNGLPMKLELLDEGSKSIFELFKVGENAEVEGLNMEGFDLFRQMVLKEIASIKDSPISVYYEKRNDMQKT